MSIAFVTYIINEAAYEGIVATGTDFEPTNAPAFREALVAAADRTVANYVKSCARLGLPVDASVASYAAHVVYLFDEAVA
jgi:hypothetical protein